MVLPSHFPLLAEGPACAPGELPAGGRPQAAGPAAEPPTANEVRRSRRYGGGLRPVYRGFLGACGGRLDFCDFKR